MLGLAHVPYTRMRGENAVLNPHNVLSVMEHEPWLASRMPATSSDFFAFENIAMCFYSRCGLDMTSSLECVFGISSKAIMKDRPWTDLALLFYDARTQVDYIEEFQRVVRQDPTRILDLYQAQVQKAESIAEIILLLTNVQRYVVLGREKKQMMLIGLNAKRVTQTLSERNIWRNGQYWVTRTKGQQLLLILNFPFTMEQKPIKEEVLDSSGDTFSLSVAFANFTEGRKGSAAVPVLRRRLAKQFPYFYNGAYFYALVHTSDDGVVTFDGNSVERSGCDFAQENPVANTNLEYVVWNSAGTSTRKRTMETNIRNHQSGRPVNIGSHPFQSIRGAGKKIYKAVSQPYKFGWIQERVQGRMVESPPHVRWTIKEL